MADWRRNNATEVDTGGLEGPEPEQCESFDDRQFVRKGTKNFRHAFCDYDISSMNSGLHSTVSDECSSAATSTRIIVREDRWYDKSSAAYFTSEATRNAQTVSWKQRHRPIFQIFLDLFTMIIMISVVLIGSVINVRHQ